MNLKIETVFVDPSVRELALAAARGDTRRIDELLAMGVNINYQGEIGLTPLAWSLYCDNYRGFSYLLEKGADPNLPFHEVGWFSAVHSAAGMRNTQYLKKVLEHGGNPNLVVEKGSWPPLIKALLAPGPAKERVTILLDAGADPNIQTIVGETSLIHAVKIEDYEAAYILVINGADPLIKSNGGKDAKYWMMQYPKGLNDYAHKLLALIAEKEREKALQARE